MTAQTQDETQAPATKTMIKGNVKNAPEGRYFREHGYTQSYPWVVIGQTASGKHLNLRKVEVTGDPEWKEKMEFYPGGFCGHVANQHQQTWLYAGLSAQTITISKNKNGEWSRKGVKFTETDGPFEFYDYNF